MVATLERNQDTPVSCSDVVSGLVDLAAASRDGHLALRRVERQQLVVERLHAARGTRLPIPELARDLGVSARTLARDVERLRDSGVPITAHPGRGGGVSLAHVAAPAPIRFDLPEAAALLSSLAVLGPTVTPSAASAMRKLADALAG
ncbi:helix-turn-helix transcriptional regulator [Actinomycetospora flava]|uniref:HTH domain-containing protein n=1 Tax=Actinomycetospora flava TaxID=3129232 RepID=A0ABU8M6P5_9PSEU